MFGCGVPLARTDGCDARCNESAAAARAGRRKEDVDDHGRHCVICQGAVALAIAGFLHGDSLHRCVCQESAAPYKAPGAPKSCPLCDQRIVQAVMKLL